MARFYLDHNVENRLARLLNEHGHNATTALAEGTMTLRDGAHLLFAARSTRIIVTHNKKDYVELHHAWLEWTAAWNVRERHSGIIIIPQNADWDLYRIANQVESIGESITSLEGRLMRWTPSSGWIEE